MPLARVSEQGDGLQSKLQQLVNAIEESEVNLESSKLTESLEPLQGLLDSVKTRNPARIAGSGTTKHFLSAMVINRVFPDDEMQFSIYEIWQWLEYYLFAGVDHFYWYDLAKQKEEYQEAGLLPYIQNGLLTYHKFSELYPRTHTSHQEFHFEQDNSARHFFNHHKAETKWVIICDVDEYMFMGLDRNPKFLSRFVRFVEPLSPLMGDPHWRGREKPVSLVRVRNVFFQGMPRLPLPSLLIERFQTRTVGRDDEGEEVAMGGNGLEPVGDAKRAKCIVLASHVQDVAERNPHDMVMAAGSTFMPPSSKIRLNHYWGLRDLNDSSLPAEFPKNVDFLEVGSRLFIRDDSMLPLVQAVRQRLQSRVKELDAALHLLDLQRLAKLAQDALQALKS